MSLLFNYMWVGVSLYPFPPPPLGMHSLLFFLPNQRPSVSFAVVFPSTEPWFIDLHFNAWTTNHYQVVTEVLGTHVLMKLYQSTAMCSDTQNRQKKKQCIFAGCITVLLSSQTPVLFLLTTSAVAKDTFRFLSVHYFTISKQLRGLHHPSISDYIIIGRT